MSACSPRARNMCARCRAALPARRWTQPAKRGFVLTLSTREQHIRREKATSQHLHQLRPLCALAFSIHMTLLGEKGLRQLALLNHAKAVAAAERLAQVPGVDPGQRQLLQRVHA